MNDVLRISRALASIDDTINTINDLYETVSEIADLNAQLREEVAVLEHDNDVLGKLLSKVTAEKETLREQIRLLTEDMPAGDARRKLAEQHAEIERLKMLLDPLPAAAGCQPANAGK